MAFLDDIRVEAIQAESDLRAELKRVSQDANLSDVGRQTAIRNAQERYTTTVRQLQERATGYVDLALQDVEKRRRQAAQEQFDKHLEAVGPAVAADLVRRRVELATPARIVEMIGEAAHEFEAATLRAYGHLEIEKRLASGGGDDADLLTAWRNLQTAAGDETTQLLDQERSLRQFDPQSLDIANQRTQFASTMGISADHVAVESL